MATTQCKRYIELAARAIMAGDVDRLQSILERVRDKEGEDRAAAVERAADILHRKRARSVFH